MPERLTYGMVGGALDAFIGDVHRKAIGFDPRAQLVAGCFSTNSERNKAAADAHFLDPARVYGSYKDMVAGESARSDGIDLAVVTTPNSTHYEISKAFLQAGIHVSCDKPLCLETWQAEELVAISREKNLVFGVTYTYTGYAMVKVMREMIGTRVIGDIVAVNAEYVNDCAHDKLGLAPDHPDVRAVWRLDPKRAGISSCVGDIGTHIEYAVKYVTGLKVKRLLATTDNYGHQLDLNANIILEYENGVRGAYWSSNIMTGKLNGLVIRVCGTKGSLEWEQHYPDYLRYTPGSGPPQILSRGCGYITQAAGSYSRLPAGQPEGIYEAFANIYKNIISAVIKLKSGEQPAVGEFDFPTAEDGLEGVKFMHAVIESAKCDSSWVEL